MNKGIITTAGIITLLLVSVLVFIFTHKDKPEATYKPHTPTMSCQGAYEAGYFGGFLKATEEAK